MISLRADVDVDLLDHDGTSAILSRSKGDPANPLLATANCLKELPGRLLKYTSRAHCKVLSEPCRPTTKVGGRRAR